MATAVRIPDVTPTTKRVDKEKRNKLMGYLLKKYDKDFERLAK